MSYHANVLTPHADNNQRQFAMKRSRPPNDGQSSTANNAFALLMGSGKKKKKELPSRFVLCPAGCGKHVADIEMNAHLDSCIVSQEALKNSKDTLEKIPDPRNLDKNKQPALATSSSGHSSLKPSNAFSHMMKRSLQVFSTQVSKVMRFHLHSDGTVCLTCYANPDPNANDLLEEIKWSAKVQVKNKKTFSAAEASVRKYPTVELIVSSAIDSANQKTRFVGRHSRLSVPVLKSILQKSIRRRKPLPSLRVAMELADKSLGDLLRRLPVIILEDSFLHPSFSLLTWLMVAQSKDFEIPPRLMVKVFCAVYEISSCPWQDHFVSQSSGSESSREISICSYHKTGIDYTLEDGEALVWCMLLRAEYGGMSCDIRMLQDFATVWTSRLSQCDLSEAIAQRVSASFPAVTTNAIRWANIPALLHQSSKSLFRVGTICQRGIPYLAMADITMEGVDFHCSSVLDSLLSNRKLVEQCCKWFEEGRFSLEPLGLDPIPDSGSEERRSWLEGVLKRCMWNYSAGVNRRLPLSSIANQMNCTKDDLKTDFWDKLIHPRTKVYAEKYITERLCIN